MAKKEQPKFQRNTRETPITITKQIDINFRNYALYVLEHRGIPGFYDALTNVQRVILMNAPKSYNKTISLVGSCISDGYHHGDSSLQGAINKIARPFACGEQLLLGDGFFGTPVNPEASAARYTSVKINPVINEIIGKNTVLNRKNDDDQWEWLRVEVPIGILTNIMGIAVGYKTTVLSRNIDNVKKYLDGDKKASLVPYFKNFKGRVSKYGEGDKTWLLEGNVEIDEVQKTVRVLEIPPMMKYDAFIKKLSNYTNNSNALFSIQNDSSDIIDITLKFKGGVTWDEFKSRIEKMTKIIVTETLVFVKDGSVVEYTDITDYLNEYRAHREYVRLLRSEYDVNVYAEELEFLNAKRDYLKFMLAKKRPEAEIDTFLSAYTSRIKGRLERILLKDLSNESLNRVVQDIKVMEKTLAAEKVNRTKIEALHEKMKNALPQRSKTIKNRSVDLFMGEEEEIDGIEVYDVNREDEPEDENDN